MPNKSDHSPLPGLIRNTVPIPYDQYQKQKQRSLTEKAVLDVLKVHHEGVSSDQLRKASGLDPIRFWLTVESLRERKLIYKIRRQDVDRYYLNEND